MKRFAGLAGFLFVAFSVAHIATGGTVDVTDPNYGSRFADFYETSANHTHALSFALGMLAVLAFLWFLGGLCDYLGAGGRGLSGTPVVVAVGGAGFAILFAGAAALGTVVGVTLAEVTTYKLDVDSALLVAWLSVLFRFGAVVAAGAMMAAAGLAARGEPRLPTPLAILGCLAAVPAVGAVLSLVIAAPLGFIVFVVAFIGLLVWTLGVSTVLLRRAPIEEL
jgi:hypothetical protein